MNALPVPLGIPSSVLAALALPETPSLEGDTVRELATEQLAHLMKSDDLKPEQIADLISALTKPNKS